MKRALLKIFNLFMACIVLMSSTGFGLIEHTCQMRGKKVRMAGIEQTTCKGCPAANHANETKGPVVKKTDCCKESSRYENVDFSSSLSQLLAKFIKATTEALAAVVTGIIAWAIDWVFEQEASASISSSHSPPLAFGRALLAIVQNFRL